ncbi:MAG: response regulator [Leptolyngbya sp. BL-A-14]
MEDNFILAANLQESLESLGYEILDTTVSCEEAIRQAIHLRPDLILMDIRLEGSQDGIQAAAFIWNQLQIPVIFLTGHSDKSTLMRAQQTFPFGYMLKPVNAQALHEAIATALDSW